MDGKSNMTFCDAHFHIVQCGHTPDISVMTGCTKYCACSCAHDPEEFIQQQEIVLQNNTQAGIILSFGIHPQNPDESFIPFLEELLENKKIGAIGEAGFDFFVQEYSCRAAEQENVWKAQLELAAKYQTPLIVHSRKAQDKLFRDAKLLRRIPSVIFHSFMGSPADALSLLRHGINGYFSFGKPLLNGKKSALSCIELLPEDRILLETDAPFQTLKGEKATRPEEITSVYDKVSAVRKTSIDSVCEQIEKNFHNALM